MFPEVTRPVPVDAKLPHSTFGAAREVPTGWSLISAHDVLDLQVSGLTLTTKNAQSWFKWRLHFYKARGQQNSSRQQTLETKWLV